MLSVPEFNGAVLLLLKATQLVEKFHLLWNVKVHCVVHKDSPLALSSTITALIYSLTTFIATTAQ